MGKTAFKFLFETISHSYEEISIHCILIVVCHTTKDKRPCHSSAIRTQLNIISLFLAIHMTDHLEALVHLVRICLMFEEIKKRIPLHLVPTVRAIYDISVTEIVHFHGIKIFRF
jgi:hypothetical protein